MIINISYYIHCERSHTSRSTHLGQIWQAPIDGSTNAKPYFYCDSAHPHQVSSVYDGGSCAGGQGTAIYTATYDPWGNVNSYTLWNSWRTATLSYDALNHLVNWSGSTNGVAASEQYVYDASGERVLKRSSSAGSTTLTVYAFGLEEDGYSGSGTRTSQLSYDSLAGHLLGAFDGTNTTFYLSDPEGSVLLSFSQNAIQGEQVSDPYGYSRYQVGNLNTAKGYIGQIQDSLTGLDYDHARYYNQDIGVFLSPDSKQGNAQGDDPYAYVAGDPETLTDPTGQRAIGCIPGHDGCGSDGTPTGCSGGQVRDGSGKCGMPGPTLNDCKADDSLKGCNKFSCSDLGGPMSTNTCRYYGNGDCNGRTYNQCQQLHKEKRARKDAMTAAGFFSTLANILGNDLLDGLFVALGIALSLLDWALAPIIGGIITGLSLAAAIIANMAGGLSSFFANEGIDQLSGQLNNAWFTEANLEGNLPQIADIVSGHSYAADGAGLLIDLVSFFGAAFKGGQVVNGIGQGAAGFNILKAGTVATVVEVVAVAAGAIILNQLADGYIQQEEADVA